MNESRELVIPTEVYSRVVGYYRPVSNWNNGKRQEFKERNTYDSKIKEAVEKEEIKDEIF